MAESFYRINSLDLGLYDSQNPNLPDYPYNFPIVSKKYDLLIPTQDPNNEDLNNPTTRSQKSLQDILQTSFQNTFLQQHTSALQSKLQNFIESIASCSEIITKQTLKTNIILQNPPYTQDCIQILRSSYCEMKIQQKMEFEVDLRYEKKLKQFLDVICQKFVPKISSEFLMISNMIWVEYLKVMDLRMDQKSLQLWGQNMVTTKFDKYKGFLERTEQKCFEDDMQASFPNFDEAMREFMTFYTVTILLVIEQCFNNPFCEDREDESLKRQFWQSDIGSLAQFAELQKCSFMKSRKYG